MILQDLNLFVQNGASRPLFLWFDEYKTATIKVVPLLKKISEKLEVGTETRSNSDKLIGILESSNPNELELARALLYVSGVFNNNTPTEHKEIIHEYLQASTKFFKNAQLADFYGQSRKKMKKMLSREAQIEHDHKLFQNEGMLYCLEFYMALYKSIIEAKDEKDKKTYIESMTVDLGSGKVPGLWADFDSDDALNKFIYHIIDDGLREKLIRAYFNAKIIILKIKMRCDKQKICQANYNGLTTDDVISTFRLFILEMMDAFQKIGIERLSSYFFTPYGSKPLIREINI